jgi:hypothetical protein
MSPLCALSAQAQDEQTYLYDVHGRLTAVATPRPFGLANHISAYGVDDALGAVAGESAGSYWLMGTND